MEMAPAREHPTIRWSRLCTTILLDGLGLDGEWGYYEVPQDHSESQSIQPGGYIIPRTRLY